MFRALLVHLILLCYAGASAQISNTSFNQLNEENGLAQNFVYGIIKDNRGFVWISTGDGLTRFDGKTSKNYTIADGLSSNFITTSYQTKSGWILYGHFQGSITAYNGAFFQSILRDTLNSEVISIGEAEDETILCATRSAGLTIWDKNLTTPTFSFPSELHGKIINQIKVIGKYLLVATSEGLYTYQINGQQLIFNDSPESFLYKEVTSIEVFKDNSLKCWVGTMGNGLFVVRPGTFTKIERSIGQTKLNNASIRTIVNDEPNSLWVGTHQNGLFHFDVQSDSILSNTVHFNETNGYPIFSVNSLLIESNQVAWVGTLSQGLVKLYKPFFNFHDTSAKNIQHINAISEGKNGYYVATDKGLFTFRINNKNEVEQFNQLNFLKTESILSIKFIDGILWIGTQANGIKLYDEEKNKLSSLTTTDNDITPVKVRLFAPDNQHHVWISAMGEGVMQIDEKGNILKHLATNTGFIHNDIYAILVDQNDNTWFGSKGSGLAMLDTKGELHRLSQNDQFPSHDINDIIEDNGTVWIATDGQGYFKQESDRFVKIGPASETESPFIKSLKADGQHRIWISTRSKIGFLDHQTGKSRYYDKNDGLSDKENYASRFFLDHLGNLLLANDKGFITFSSNEVGKPIILDTYLSGISISFAPYKPVAPTAEERSKGNYPSAKLNHDQNHVTLDFKAIDTNFTGPIYYRYYLDDLEKDWSPASLSNSITYTSLEPGRYTFHAQATNDLRAWTDLPLTYSFAIAKPYWDTWWFYLLQMFGIVALFGSTFLLIRSPVTKRSLGRIMVFMCIFIIFDYFQNWLDPITPEFIGSVPLYKTILNLCLALILFPVERGIKKFFKKQEKHSS